jgi:hypothetical protein
MGMGGACAASGSIFHNAQTAVFHIRFCATFYCRPNVQMAVPALTSFGRQQPLPPRRPAPASPRRTRGRRFSHGRRWFGWRRARLGGAAQSHGLGYRRAPRRVAGRDQWMLQRQTPAGAVLVGRESVLHPQMTSQSLAAKPALEAHHILIRDRLSDGHRRLGRLGLRRPAAETLERSMHLANQSRELVGRDPVVPNVTADDLRNMIKINLPRRAVAFHVPTNGPCLIWPWPVITAGSAAQLRQLGRYVCVSPV